MLCVSKQCRASKAGLAPLPFVLAVYPGQIGLCDTSVIAIETLVESQLCRFS